jgi:adenine-specific DNA-methyltransferase
MERLKELRRIGVVGSTLRYIRYVDDYPVEPITNNWNDTGIAGFASDKIYVVQTYSKVIERCLLMTTDPGDLVLDITCGSGTTAVVAEQWGRRWITCDTSRVAITLAKQRLMTAKFDYYTLRYPEEGLRGGFIYRTVPHITIKSLVNDLPPDEEILYDQPKVEKDKVRVTGPFTVEAVPFAMVLSLDETISPSADATIARSGHTARINDWIDELVRSGVRGKAGQRIEFADLELIPSMKYLQASGIDKNTGERIVVSFGPEFAPLGQKQVEIAIEEASKLVPKPKIVLFCAFSFDPEAAKNIDEMVWSGVTLLRIQMNADLLTEDLKKKSKNTDSFWLMGQPDVELRREGEKYVVEVRGFDYFDTKKGEIISGGKGDIAMWLLDTDYDGRSMFPRQVFFPMASATEGWAKLAKSLKAVIDEELIEAYRGTVSLPFKAGEYKRAAVKIVDGRGVESLKIIGLG